MLRALSDDSVDHTQIINTLSDVMCFEDYELLFTEGKDNNKVFYYRVSHDGVILGEGKGKSKKAAEQEAAKVALSKLAK